jgi:ATP-binding cassette subfamily B protein
VADSGGKVSLTRLLIRRPALFASAVVAVLVETLLLQAGPYLVQIGIDHGIAARDLRVLVIATVAFALAVVLTGFATAVRMRQTGRLAASATRDLRIRIFAHLQRMSLDYYTSEKAGVTMTRMTSDVEAVQSLLQDGFAQFGIQALTMVLVTAVLFHYNTELALITVLLVVPPLTVASLWFRHAADRGYNRQRDTIAAMFADLAESLNGNRVVTAHNRQDRNVVAHRTVVGEYRDANDHTGRINAIYGPGTSVIGLIAMAVMLLLGGRMVLRGTLTIGELTAFVLYINAFFQPVQQLVTLYTQYQQAKAAVGKIRGLLSTAPSVAHAPSAAVLPPVQGAINFDDVTFGYRADTPVLSHVDLSIAPGETVACVGPTGAGKSTLAKLVTRFYDPLSGAVRIDGHDLRDVTLESLRRQIGVVPQEPFLFAGTLRDNIAFRPPRGDRRRGVGGGRRGRPARPGGTLARGPGHPAARARPVRLVRRAAAARAGPGLPRRAACGGPGRGDLQPRPALGAAGRGGAGRAARGAYRDPRRAPAVHRDAGRPDHRGRRPPHRGVRLARRAGRGRRRLRRHVRDLGGARHHLRRSGCAGG